MHGFINIYKTLHAPTNNTKRMEQIYLFLGHKIKSMVSSKRIANKIPKQYIVLLFFSAIVNQYSSSS